MAGLIPGARFVPLHSQNHILLADEPAWPELVAELTAFVGGVKPSSATAVLTAREVDVLRLVAQGCSNEEIVEEFGSGSWGIGGQPLTTEDVLAVARRASARS